MGGRENMSARTGQPECTRQLKIANINDMTGFGRCSLAAAWPIVSCLGVQLCPLPTAILSNHTGFESFYMEDFTEQMRPYMDEWKKLDLHFDGILTGFLGSAEQIDIVEDFFGKFADENTCVMVDPAMGDDGILYQTYSTEFAAQMRRLLPYASVVTPNLTEACVLANTPYSENPTEAELVSMAQVLSEMGPAHVAITGVNRGDHLDTVCYERNRGIYTISTELVESERAGTGDVFSAVVAAGMLLGVDFKQCVQKAADFVHDCLAYSEGLGIPENDGVFFEPLLSSLSFDA